MLALGTEGLVALVAIVVAVGIFGVAFANQRRQPSPFNVTLMWLTAGIALLAPTLLDIGPPSPLVYMAIGAAVLCSVLAVWSLIRHFRGFTGNVANKKGD